MDDAADFDDAEGFETALLYGPEHTDVYDDQSYDAGFADQNDDGFDDADPRREPSFVLVARYEDEFFDEPHLMPGRGINDNQSIAA